MLVLLAAILGVLWLLGLIGHIAGGFIHLVLVVALVLFIVDFIGRRGRSTNL